MFKQVLKTVLGGAVALSTMGFAHAAVDTYMVDPSHTYPSFEADHLGGLSLWRGQFEKPRVWSPLDRANKTGTVDIEIDATSLDFGSPTAHREAETAKAHRG